MPNASARQARSYVFLSYASADRVRALSVASALESSGIAVWIDRTGILGGSSWAEEIVEAVRGCAALTVLCSAGSMESRNVRQELQLAWDANRPILPLILEPVEFPAAIAYFLNGRQWIDLRGRTQESWLDELRASLRRQNIGDVVTPSPLLSRTEVDIPDTPGPLLGRDREVAELVAHYETGSGRLVTLIGPAGVGKTRLAIEIARRVVPMFAGDLILLDLSPLRDPLYVESSIAESLGVQQRSDHQTRESLRAVIASRRLFLVLDNFEQVIDAASLVRDLVSAAPELRVLVTSREPLRVRGELEYAVTPLQLADESQILDVDRASDNPAIALFVEAATAVKPGFSLTGENAAVVAEICRRLDGLPLAIELAAARVRHYPPSMLLERMSPRLPLLTGGRRDQPARQRTMQDAIAWSYDLLGDDEQALFRCLGVFAGGAEFAAIDSVMAEQMNRRIDTMGGLASLVDKSLVREVDDESGMPRFSMFETVREFAQWQLERAGEVAGIQAAHARWFNSIALRAFKETDGSRYESAYEHLRVDNQNLREALESLIDRGETELARGMAGALAQYWYSHGLLREGRHYLEVVLGMSGTSSPESIAHAQIGLAQIAHYQGDSSLAASVAESALAVYEQLGDPELIGTATYYQGVIAEDTGDFDLAERRLTDAIASFERVPDANGICWSIYHLGVVAHGKGDIDQAIETYEEALQCAQLSGTHRVTPAALEYLGLAHIRKGDLNAATSRLENALQFNVDDDDWEGMARNVSAVACLASTLELFDEACRLLATAETIRMQIGLRPFPLPESTDFDRALNEARLYLGEQRFATAWAEGQSRTSRDCDQDIQVVLDRARGIQNSTS